jgi:hypothetical protein
MSIGYICTPEQKDLIQGQYYTPYQFFNCVQDINGVWFLFLSYEDRIEVLSSAYAWVLDLPEAEYIPPPSPPFPPTE